MKNFEYKRKSITVVASLLMCIVMVLGMVGCGKKDVASDNDETTNASTYEYVHREVAEPVYHNAAEKFAEGTGEKNNPYLISTVEELVLFSELVNNDELDGKYLKAYYKLAEDIALNDVSSFGEWASKGPEFSWKPIGLNWEFEGVFDGDGHTISGMYINVDIDSEKTETSSYKYGLFSKNNGTVKNVKVENSYICVSGNCYTNDVGTIVAVNQADGVIKNCKADSVIECYDAKSGGITGLNEGLVENCEFSGSVAEIKDYSMNMLGGIAGESRGKIINCTNNGSITADKISIEHAGGIVASLSDGTVENCVNNGSINCDNGKETEEKPISVYGNEVGGIAGKIFSTKIGGEEFQNKEISVVNCVNNGEIKGAMHGAGMVASVNNDGSDYPVKITGCSNNGKVSAGGYSAGIVADAKCSGKELAIENCKNTADISKSNSAGVLALLMPTKGEVNIKNCENTGNISNSDLYSAGIICCMYYSQDVDGAVNVEGCVNSGKITTPVSGGGIIGIINSTGVLSISEESVLNVKNCSNVGEIYTTNSNSFIGGIIGGLGLKDVACNVSDCVNSGDLTVEDVEPSKETTESVKEMELSRMCGGIIGRVGDTLLLSTSADRGNTENVNSEKASIKVINCKSTGKFNVPDENKYKYSDGENIYTNHIGGIIGNCSGEDGYAFYVKDCDFTNADKMLGTEEIRVEK